MMVGSRTVAIIEAPRLDIEGRIGVEYAALSVHCRQSGNILNIDTMTHSPEIRESNFVMMVIPRKAVIFEGLWL